MSRLYVSIIIRCNDKERFIRNTLDSIFSQDFRDFEAIVVESGPTDVNRRIIREYDVKLLEITPQEFSWGRSLSLGLNKSEAEIIVFLNADAIPKDKRWLANLIKPFSDPEVGAVQGLRDLNSPVHGIFYWDKVNCFDFTRPMYKWKKRYGFGFSTDNCAVRRNLLQGVGLENIVILEDKFIQKYLIERNIKIRMVNDADVYHNHVYTVKSLFRRTVNMGVGWRAVGIRYTLRDLLRDFFHYEVFQNFVYGIRYRQIRTMAELLFPVLSPVFLWIGNNLKRAVYTAATKF